MESITELQWKQGSPTEPGRYVRVQGFHGVAILCHVIKQHNEFLVMEWDSPGGWPMKAPMKAPSFDKCLWFGPIPDPPNGKGVHP